MQSMQRSFGRLLNKAPNTAKVSVILKDYEDADHVLLKIIESNKSWRESWVHLVNHQLAAVTEYAEIYAPIAGSTDGHGRDCAPTPAPQVERTARLRDAYTELKDDVMVEVAEIESRIVRPASDARDTIQPVRSTIKKREDKRAAFEKAQDKVAKLGRKPNRNAKEEAALARAEMDLANANDEFNIADDHLRQTIPPIIQAAFSLIPPLLCCHVEVQNKLLGLYYTFLHTYCGDYGFPSPPPPMDHVVDAWKADFQPIQREVEGLSLIARGRAMNAGRYASASTAGRPDMPGSRKPSTAGSLLPPTDQRSYPSSSRGDDSRSPSPQPSPRIPRSPSGGFGAHLRATDFTTATVLGTNGTVASPDAVGGRSDYFSRPAASPSYSASNTPSLQTPSTYSPVLTPGGSVVAKKRPPPPPPPTKPKPRLPPDEFVVALYDFTGQSAGDLSFREGDRIRIVKRTATDQDWWQGEVRGVKGSFPANYTRTEA